MKANEAPENNKRKAPDKIYARFGIFGMIHATEIRVTSKDIEYTRTDAFIEKAQLFLIDKLKEIPMGNGKMKIKADCSLEGFIEDFRNYMEGE